MKFISWIKKHYQYDWFKGLFSGIDDLPWDFFVDYCDGDVEMAARIYRSYYGMTDKTIHKI